MGLSGGFRQFAGELDPAQKFLECDLGPDMLQQFLGQRRRRLVAGLADFAKSIARRLRLSLTVTFVIVKENGYKSVWLSPTMPSPLQSQCSIQSGLVVAGFSAAGTSSAVFSMAGDRVRGGRFLSACCMRPSIRTWGAVPPLPMH